MIYLFNSAYRPLYTVNVLNTLFLPSGCTNEYRYRIRGDVIHIEPGSPDKFSKAAEENERVAVIFIDRFGGSGYEYHPLRLGNLAGYREADDRSFFTVKLYDFVYPVNNAAFNDQIKRSLGSSDLPKLTGNDPENRNDGYYAIKSGNMFNHLGDFYWREDAWKETVEELQKTRAFQAEQCKEEFSAHSIYS